MALEIISETVEGESAACLREIRDEECQLAIWHREPPFEADDLLASTPDDVRLTVSLVNLIPRLRHAFDEAGYRPTQTRDALIADVSDLVERFAGIAGVEQVGLRLAVVDTDSCRKFHADWVSARLITTYSGPGTEWIDHEDAVRVSNSEEPRTIHRLKPGDVGIFKGRLATDRPAIHRSPPIAGTGTQRLLLVIDPAEGGD